VLALHFSLGSFERQQDSPSLPQDKRHLHLRSGSFISEGGEQTKESLHLQVIPSQGKFGELGSQHCWFSPPSGGSQLAAKDKSIKTANKIGRSNKTNKPLTLLLFILIKKF
jgi:hypothetical protein